MAVRPSVPLIDSTSSSSSRSRSSNLLRRLLLPLVLVAWCMPGNVRGSLLLLWCAVAAIIACLLACLLLLYCGSKLSK